MSEYRMQIVHQASGQVVQWRPGKEVEVDLVEAVCGKVKERSAKFFDLGVLGEEVCRLVQAKGVGIMASEGKVLSAIRQAFEELPYEFRMSAQSASMQNAIRQGIEEVLLELKRKI